MTQARNPTDAREVLRKDLFLLEIDGIAGVGFSFCSGLEVSRRLSSYAEGGRDRAVLLDDGSDPGALRLERGLTRDPSLFAWFESGEARDGAIVAIDSVGRERARWRFLGAIPTRWKGGEWSARASRPGSIAGASFGNEAFALEALELSYEAIEWTRS